MAKKTLILLSAFLILAACGNKQGGEQSGDMSEFAENSSFQAAHENPEDIVFQPKGTMIQFDTPDGKKGNAYTLTPENKTNTYLFVIQEWWGLNDHIRQEAERLFDSLGNVTVLALDMYDGKVATTQEEAGKYMQAASQVRGEAIVKGALTYVGKDAQIATIGWCFGGGWSLQASILAGDQAKACVMYYGMPVQNAKELAPLKAPVLGIFAKQDGWITPEVAKKFEDLAKATGKNVEIHQFDAAHAFANPSNPDYNEEATKGANTLALAFLKAHLQ
ncbi:MAG: dienelactone hydrolase family protein [Saprospiraceae bacterium]|nr:dienelactone hydrolase family protein [Saprospiraceae bacterium]